MDLFTNLFDEIVDTQSGAASVFRITQRYYSLQQNSIRTQNSSDISCQMRTFADMLLLRGRLLLQLLDRRLQLRYSLRKEFFVYVELQDRQLKLKEGVSPVAEFNQFAMWYTRVTAADGFDLARMDGAADSLLRAGAKEGGFADLPETGVSFEEGKHPLYLSHSSPLAMDLDHKGCDCSIIAQATIYRHL